MYDHIVLQSAGWRSVWSKRGLPHCAMMWDPVKSRELTVLCSALQEYLLWHGLDSSFPPLTLQTESMCVLGQLVLGERHESVIVHASHNKVFNSPM